MWVAKLCDQKDIIKFKEQKKGNGNKAKMKVIAVRLKKAKGSKAKGS